MPKAPPSARESRPKSAATTATLRSAAGISARHWRCPEAIVRRLRARTFRFLGLAFAIEWKWPPHGPEELTQLGHPRFRCHLRQQEVGLPPENSRVDSAPGGTYLPGEIAAPALCA
ncbi:hypothetical protein SPHV1_50053 [Novosphingobium sp. KN65.2]|nr:hypothetical protein SPHV1_50053 [Novosphingobium sp. KN65.2]